MLEEGLKSLDMRLVLIGIIFLIMSCKEKQNIDLKTNLMAENWEILKTSIINDENFDWQKFIIIEGQNAEEYSFLFKNETAKETLKKTTYETLNDYDFYGTPVKVFSYELPNVKEKHTFYILEKNNEFKIIGYLMTNF